MTVSRGDALYSLVMPVSLQTFHRIWRPFIQRSVPDEENEDEQATVVSGGGMVPETSHISDSSSCSSDESVEERNRL